MPLMNLLRVTIGLLLSVILTSPAAAAGPQTPDGWPLTRAGLIARDWVTAFGAGDDSMSACLTRHMTVEGLARRPMAERLVNYRRLHEDLGTLSLFSVNRETATELTVTLMASDMSKHRFTFNIQAADPYKLLTVTTTQSMHSIPGLGWLHH